VEIVISERVAKLGDANQNMLTIRKSEAQAHSEFVVVREPFVMCHCTFPADSFLAASYAPVAKPRPNSNNTRFLQATNCSSELA